MFGFHLREYTKTELNKIKKNNCNFVQTFAENIKTVNDVIETNKIKDIKYVIHSSFLINISQKFNKQSYTIIKCIEEIKEAMKYKAIGYVLHAGTIQTKHYTTQQQSFTNMIKTLLYISKYFRLDQNNNFTLFLEILAGDKNDIIYKIEDENKYLSLNFFNKVITKYPLLNNLKYCLDTCHLFASGYDLKTQIGFQNFLNDFNKYIGLNKIGLIHLNDSYYDFNTRKDRHEVLGKGFIGDNLKNVFITFYKMKIPIIIEVKDITKNMKLIKKAFKEISD